MTLESLLLSQDGEVLRVLRPALEKLSIQVEVCQEAQEASAILISEKFDAVIVDCDDLAGGLAVLQGLRATPSNHNSVTFALLNGKKTTTQEAFGMGVNFVLQKPISSLNAARCLNAALGFMERERRRYCRQPVKMMVKVVMDEKEFQANSTNISEGGMALVLQETLPRGVIPRVCFTLPETTMALDLEAEVAWVDPKGHAGLRFHHVPQSSQEFLEKWLTVQMEKRPVSAEARPGSGPELLQ